MPGQPGYNISAFLLPARQGTTHRAGHLVEGRHLVRLHGELIAYGWVEQNTGNTPVLTRGAVVEQILREAGDPDDPVAVMMVQQLVLAHFRIAQLHASAGQAQGLEGIKILNSAAARMLGEFRRTALALRAYCGRLPEGRPEKDLKLFKIAQ